MIEEIKQSANDYVFNHVGNTLACEGHYNTP